jgi:hypothetical protein
MAKSYSSLEADRSKSGWQIYRRAGHDQPYGSRAKQALSALAFGKTVSIEDKDRYGRTIGLIHVGQADHSWQSGQPAKFSLIRRESP